MTEHSDSPFLIHRLIIFCLLTSFVLGLVGYFAFAFNSAGQFFTWQMCNCFLMAACTLMGAMLARQGSDIAASGYYILAIALGFIYAAFAINQKSDAVFASGIVIYIPAVILISFYKKFPVWLRILSGASAVPFSVILVTIYFFPPYDPKVLQPLSFMVLLITAFCWAMMVWKQLRNMKRQ